MMILTILQFFPPAFRIYIYVVSLKTQTDAGETGPAGVSFPPR